MTFIKYDGNDPKVLEAIKKLQEDAMIKKQQLPKYELVQVEKLGNEVINVVVRDSNNQRAFVGVIREVNNPKSYMVPND